MYMIKHNQLQVGIHTPAQGKNPYSLLTTRDRRATLPIAFLVSTWVVETEAPVNVTILDEQTCFEEGVRKPWFST